MILEHYGTFTLFSRSDDHRLSVYGVEKTDAGAEGSEEESEVFYSEEETMERDPPVAELKDTEAEAWDDMCQTIIKESSREVKKSATAWGKLSSAGKLIQIVASHITRQEANT